MIPSSSMWNENLNLKYYYQTASYRAFIISLLFSIFSSSCFYLTLSFIIDIIFCFLSFYPCFLRFQCLQRNHILLLTITQTKLLKTHSIGAIFLFFLFSNLPVVFFIFSFITFNFGNLFFLFSFLYHLSIFLF